VYVAMSHKRIPLYEQIEAILRQRLHTMQAGERLPSDRDLAQEFSVSFVTARQAVSRLAADGLVERHVGRGTFVASARLEKNMSGLTSFSEDMIRRGLSVHSKVLECTVRPASQAVAQALQIAENSPVVHIRRVRFADAIPMTIEAVNLHALAFPGLAGEDFSHQSLYEVLERRYGVALTVARGVLSAVTPTTEEAQMLGITRATPLLVVSRTAYNQHNEPIEYGESRYRSDRYQVPIEMWSPRRNARTAHLMGSSSYMQPSPI
jgi:GntR family transcriptional regulator